MLFEQPHLSAFLRQPCLDSPPSGLTPYFLTRTVRRWSVESEEALKDFFNTDVWEELSIDIDSLTDCIID